MAHLIREQRYTISELHKKNFTQAQIAEIVGVSQATISKELRRNATKTGKYSSKLAQEMADERKKRFTFNRKFTPKIEAFIREKITKEQWSPDQIVGFCRKNHYAMVSVERIYQFIRLDKACGGILYKYCRHKLKHRKKCVGKAGAGHIPNRISIHERPDIVDNREDFGHWEMDLIQNGSDFFVTLVERKCRYLLMEKLEHGKQTEGVMKTVCKLLKPYQKYVKTITTDNGGEFAGHIILKQKLAVKVYFTDPYSSWQKGTVENTNKLIRQYIPKNMNVKSLTYNDLVKIQIKINNRPRKVLNYNTPAQLFYNFVG